MLQISRHARGAMAAAVSLIASCGFAQDASLPWVVGTAKVDVTPTEPVRMAGYGSRDHPSEGVDTPLYVRCLAINQVDRDRPASLLISVDTIGLPGSITRELATSIREKHGTPRDQIVFCSTHTHCGPDLISELSNIFATELSQDEIDAGLRYKTQLHKGILSAVDQALQEMKPARLSYAVGETGFAANRRVLTDGKWTGFGIQSDGPVDHSVPVLKAVGRDGAIRAVVFNYACHCTTLGGRHYRINAEWAGYACQSLESTYPESVALCTIGCGADANPNPRESLDATKLHGRTLAAEVKRVVGGKMRTVDRPLESRFDYAGLSFELPTAEELKRRVESGDRPQTKRHAERLLEVYRREGRLPATYPVPIQTWRFGDQLTMVFLGGEVVVDYALRLKKTFSDPNLWVTAYANDVLGYIVSERMRAEGGYEFDRSGVYYGLPGPWAAGTEDFLINRVKELVESKGRSQPLDPDAALSSMELRDGYRIELVASEPLVTDPVNLAFGGDGRLWVVEMGDYPEGENGGCVKVLTDTDGDGRYDTAARFLDKLPFPTGVQPWGDGVLVASAPDILFARDTDGDDRADEIEKVFTGFRLANPQHRVGGFTYGLDHSLHCSSGDNLGEITSIRTGKRVDASGHDVKIWPDRGELAAVSGRTQYIRSRNDWGEWFGNDNSRPMYHFPIESVDLKRNPSVSYAGNQQQLFDPPVAPRVFPSTAATERFNDLFAANRFTSACSSIVFRAPNFRQAGRDVVFICEPVHNLVHRAVLERYGASFRATRSEGEQQSEFLTSTDPWFRPARVITGPDGGLWVADMYRETIEHPEWIPQAWQQQLDLRAGQDRGRIYRVSADQPLDPTWKTIDSRSVEKLAELLRSPNGMLRDMAQRHLITRGDHSVVPTLVAMSREEGNPQSQVHALSILGVLNKLDDETLLAAMSVDHPGVLMVAIRLCRSRIDRDSRFLARLDRLASHEDARVVLQTALALGDSSSPVAGESLASIAARPNLDRWVARAVSTSAAPHAGVLTTKLLDRVRAGTLADSDAAMPLLSEILRTARDQNVDVSDQIADVLAGGKDDLDTRLRLAALWFESGGTGEGRIKGMLDQLKPLYEDARRLIRDTDTPNDRRCRALSLVGLGIGSPSEERALLVSLLTPATPPVVQMQAIDLLTRSGDVAASDDLVGRWASMSSRVRDHCVSRMLSRRSWSESLIAALESDQIAVSDLTAAARQQLAQTGSRSMRVRAARVLRSGGSIEKQELVRKYLSHSDEQGDPSRGQVLFKKHCAVCHVPDTQGRAIGASLDNLSDRRTRPLVEAILDPNRAVDPKFQNYLIHTHDDRILAGAIEEEAGSSITLAHADGKRTTINRAEIAMMKNSGVSLMPEGFEDVMSPDELRDLIQYLQASLPQK